MNPLLIDQTGALEKKQCDIYFGEATETDAAKWDKMFEALAVPPSGHQFIKKFIEGSFPKPNNPISS